MLLCEGDRSGEVLCTSARLVGCLRKPWQHEGCHVPGMKPMRSFDWRAEPVDNGREELVAILNACRTNIECFGNK